MYDCRETKPIPNPARVGLSLCVTTACDRRECLTRSKAHHAPLMTSLEFLWSGGREVGTFAEVARSEVSWKCFRRDDMEDVPWGPVGQKGGCLRDPKAKGEPNAECGWSELEMAHVS